MTFANHSLTSPQLLGLLAVWLRPVAILLFVDKVVFCELSDVRPRGHERWVLFTSNLSKEKKIMFWWCLKMLCIGRLYCQNGQSRSTIPNGSTENTEEIDYSVYSITQPLVSSYPKRRSTWTDLEQSVLLEEVTKKEKLLFGTFKGCGRGKKTGGSTGICS